MPFLLYSYNISLYVVAVFCANWSLATYLAPFSQSFNCNFLMGSDADFSIICCVKQTSLFLFSKNFSMKEFQFVSAVVLSLSERQ